MTPLSMVSWTLLRINPVNSQWPTGATYVAQTWFARRGGPKQHHLTEWIAYQPRSHLVWLALARNGILVAAAAFLVLASVWWLRQHPAE